MEFPPRRRLRPAIVAFFAFTFAGCSPLYLWDTHTTSTSAALSFNAATLAREPVAIFGLIAPSGFQGLNSALSHGLVMALSETSPPLRGIANHEVMNRLNQKDFVIEYADLIAGFGRSGILERARLERIGSILDSRYVFLPGLAEYNQVIIDRLQVGGLKFIQSRVITLRLWLQLWDSQMGQILWESSGEITAASELLRPERAVPLDEIAQKLWLRMVQDNLLAEKDKSKLF